MQEWLDVSAVAERFGMKPQVVRKAIHKKGLTAYRIGGRFRVKPEDLDAWLETQKVHAQ